MATFTINAADTNIDACTSKAGDDTYNISNNYTLTIDQDTRGGLNNDTSSIMGAVSPSSSLGGNVTLDGRYVRLIPYDTGSGNVPAWNSTITQGSASGKLIAVYSALNVASTATGAAMPASGYIKIKAWNETAYAAGALTGIGANATGADRVGWIEVVGTEAPRNWLFNRLNNASTPFSQGDMIEIGTTDGNRATTYQIPSNGVNQYHSGVFVQKAASATITAAAYSAGTVTFTATGHGFTTGDQVVLQNIIPNTYNRLKTKGDITVVDANTFTLPYQSDPGTYTSGGTAVPIEGYPATADTFVSTNISTSALKGKFCSITPATGLVRFGHDGVNSSGGYIVPTGRKIFMPNVFLTGATTAAKTQNAFNTGTSIRPRFVTSGGARLDIRQCSMNFGQGSISSGYYWGLTDCVYDQAIPINHATPFYHNNVIIGQHTTAAAYQRLGFSTVTTGIDFTDVTIGFGTIGATAVTNVGVTDCINVSFVRCKFLMSSPRGGTSQTHLAFSRALGITMTDCTVGGAPITGSSSSTADITNLTWFDTNGGLNVTANPVYMLTLTTQCLDWTVDGINIADGDLPRNALFSGGSSSARTTIKNVGTRATPIGTGLYEEEDATWARVTTTATVTTASPHGLVTGDFIEIYRTPDVAAFGRQSITVTVTGASTFTFICTNGGATSGVLSYYPVAMARIYLCSNYDTLKVQNVHVRGIRSGLVSIGVDSIRVYHENVSSQWQDATSTLLASSNLFWHGSSISPINPAAVSGLYGTHISTGYTAELAVPNGSTVAWTRVTVLATITKANHGLVTGQKILITTSDNQAAFLPGATAQVTALTKNTFTVACVNSGTTAGNLSYTVADGLMMLSMNEPNSGSTSYVTLGGQAAFTGAGSVALFNVNDSITLETERWILDYDYAENMLPFMSAGGGINNYDITYDINTGSGYSGSFKNAFYQRTGGGGASASTTVTMTSTTGVAVNDYVYGLNIAEGTKVVSIDSATAITVTVANTGVVSGTLVFNQLPNVTGLPTTGFKMKVKINCITATTTAITYLRLFWRSTATTRDNLYPQETFNTQTVTVAGATAGSRIQLYDLTSGTELYNGTPTFPYTWTDTETWVADREIRLRVSYVSGVTAKEYISTTIGTVTNADYDLTYLVTQTDDTVYNTNAVNGSTTTGITISATRYSMTVSRTCAQLYAFAMYTAFTETGIRDYGLAMTAVDTANYFLDEVLLKNTSSGPAIAISITGGWLRDYDTGVALDLVDTTGGTLFQSPDHVVAYASASDYTQIADAVWSDTATYAAGEKGKVLKDANDNAELAAIK